MSNEVKELAKDTAAATGEIGKQVDEIQKNSEEVIITIGQITDIITKINEGTNSVACAIEEQTATTNEITHNIANSANSTTQISENFNRVLEAVLSTKDITAQTNTVSATLESISNALSELLAKFTLPKVK